MDAFHVDDRRYLRFSTLAAVPGLAHAFSTRPHDVSARADEQATMRALRRARMARDLGFDPARLTHTIQVHRTTIAIVDEPCMGRAIDDCDGLITSLARTPLMTFSADCPLVLAVDPVRRVVGMVHASWRCTVAEMSAKLVALMHERFGCDTRAIHAGVGPSAGPESYEVGRDVIEASLHLPGRDRIVIARSGRTYFDLWEANRLQLIHAGVPAEQIEIAGIDTMQATDRLYSFRREGAGCGHFGLMAGIVAENAD